MPLTVARCHEAINDQRQAEQEFRKAVQANPDDIALMVEVAAFYSRTDDFEKAETHLKFILDPKSNAPEDAVQWARRRQALDVASTGGYENTTLALKMLGGSQQEIGDISVTDLRVRASILARRSVRRDRIALIGIYEEIARRQALTPFEQFQLARLYEATGQWPKAEETIQNLIDQNPANGSYVSYYTHLLVEQKKLEQVELKIPRVEAHLPNSLVAVLLKSRFLHLQDKTALAATLLQDHLQTTEKIVSPEQTFRDLAVQGKAEEALAWLEEHLKDQGDSTATGALQDGRRLLAEGNAEAAAAVLKKYLQRTDIRRLVHQFQSRIIARVLADIGQFAAAEKVFRDSMPQSDHPADIVILLGYVARQGRLQEALDLCQQAWQRDDIPPELTARTSVDILRAGEASAGQIQQVGSWLQAAIRENPQSTTIVARLADLHDYAGRYDEAEKLYRAILLQKDRSLMALNNLDWLLALQHKNGTEALKFIDLAGPVAELLDTRAIVHLALNNP